MIAWNEWNAAAAKLAHREGRTGIRYESDLKLWGRPEDWRIPEADYKGRFAGDCDGFVFFCRDRLRRTIAGLDAIVPFPLFPVACKIETGEWHLVLGISTGDGVKVLDSRQARIVTPAELRRMGYTRLYRPGPGQAMDEHAWLRMAA
jgi:predicted transglutaminase-like cysteine proteinase